MSANNLIYSLSWADTVVSALQRAYPRATEIVFTVYGITPRCAAIYLASRSPVWPYLRERIHQVEKLHRRSKNYLTYAQYLAWECSLLHQIRSEIVHQELDKLLDRANNSRAGISRATSVPTKGS